MTGIETKVDDLGLKRVSAVQTPSGTINTNCVVNCTGVWAPNVGALCGVTVPLVAMYHAYIVTERIEGIQNMPNVRDHDASVYLKLQGDGLSVGGYENNPTFWDEVRAIDLFTDMAAILKLLVIRSIMGCPGGPRSVLTCAFLIGKKRTSLCIPWEKGDNYYSQTQHNGLFFPLQSFSRKTSRKIGPKST